uniref:Uncharacterized protein n=1 Tax=Castor canadensis TaxID=51338 RepID=A0A8C0WCE5_CASCN
MSYQQQQCKQPCQPPPKYPPVQPLPPCQQKCPPKSK